MKKGEVFEFKADTFGIGYPENIGVCLGTSKKGKRHLVVAFTLKGKQYMRPEFVTKKNLGRRIGEEELNDSFALKETLKSLIREIRGGKGKMGKDRRGKGKGEKKGRKHTIDSSRVVKKTVEPKDIWLEARKIEKDVLSGEEIAAAYLKTKASSSSEIIRIRGIISDGIADELPYFIPVKKKRDLYRLLSEENYIIINRDIACFRKLAKGVEKYRRERGLALYPGADIKELTPGKLLDIFGEDFDIADLGIEWGSGDDVGSARRIWDSACRSLAEFIKHDKWAGNIGLGKMNIRRTEDFDLKRSLTGMALDIAGSKRTTFSTAFTVFLIATGHWTIEEALSAFIERYVNTKVFDFWTGYPRIYDERLLSARAMGNRSDRDQPERKDLRHLFTVTVDPIDAKDFDDAISMVSEGENTVLYVHIADVSHYVGKDGPLDREALRRCTSVYLPDTVLPMLPEILSNDLCSLRSEVDRLAMTTKMIYGPDLELVDFEIFPSVILVDRNLSYGDVLDSYHKGVEPFRHWIDFSERLWSRRDTLNLETAEMKIHISGNTVQKEQKRGNRATKMIECFMVTTNEVIAMFMTAFTENIIYRVHGMPDSVNLERYNAIAKRLGFETFTLKDGITGRGKGKRKDGVSDKRKELDLMSSGNISFSFGDKAGEEMMKTLGLTGGKETSEEGKKGTKSSYLELSERKFRQRLRNCMDGNDSGMNVQRLRTSIREYIGELVDLKKRDALLVDINRVLDFINKKGDDNCQAEGGDERRGDGDYKGERNDGSPDDESSMQGGNDGSPDDESSMQGGNDGSPDDESSMQGGNDGKGDEDKGKYLEKGIDPLTREILNVNILRSLQLAIYSPQNITHFGLGSDCYLHFTSPIRRYADLVTHRVLKTILDWKRDGDEDSHREKVERTEIETGYSLDEIEEISERCSLQSRDADRFERIMNDVTLCIEKTFDDEFWNETHEGMITGVIPGGIFIRIESGIEGFVPIRKISRERLGINDNEIELVPLERTDKKRKKRRKGVFWGSPRSRENYSLGIGDRVQIRVKRCSIEEGKIEFRLAG